MLKPSRWLLLTWWGEDVLGRTCQARLAVTKPPVSQQEQRDIFEEVLKRP